MRVCRACSLEVIVGCGAQIPALLMDTWVFGIYACEMQEYVICSDFGAFGWRDGMALALAGWHSKPEEFTVVIMNISVCISCIELWVSKKWVAV